MKIIIKNGLININRFKNETKNTSIGSIHYSKSSGYFKVIDIDNKYDIKNHKNRYLIQFIATSFITNTSSGHVITGEVYDYELPRICNIAYLGKMYPYIKKHEPKKLIAALYQRWISMIKRCYDKNNKKYRLYGKLGISVDKAWFNFSEFYYDALKLKNFNANDIINGNLTLDKDFLQQNLNKCNMIYSKDTCCWLTKSEQNKLIDFSTAHINEMKKFIVIYNDKMTVVKGIRSFEKLHNLRHGTITKMIDNGTDLNGYRFKKYENEE